jgi:hypothetical protein
MAQQKPLHGDDFSLSFSDREVTAWGGLALLKKMFDQMGLATALSSWDLPQPRSNRGYTPPQLIEQFIVSIWCGASRFAHADTVRMDRTLTRLFGWERAAGQRSIVRLFQRFDMARNELVQRQAYRWLFSQMTALKRITLDLDSTVLPRHGTQEGAARGYNPGRRGHLSHHPLMAFIAEARMVANFWLRPGNVSSAHNVQQFLESTLDHLGDMKVGLLRADSGFFSQSFLNTLEEKALPYIIAARLTRPLQQKLYQAKGWWAVSKGIELTEISYQCGSWDKPRRIVVVRQAIAERQNAPGKLLRLFADDPDIQGWRYGAFVTSLELSNIEVWRLYRGRADCENRIKELKSDFGLNAFNLGTFYATEAALGFAMLAYNLMSLFRQTVIRSKTQHTLSTLHGQVLANAAWWHPDKNQNHLLIALPRRKRSWFSGLWENATEPLGSFASP